MPPPEQREHARHADEVGRGLSARAFLLRDALLAAALVPVPMWAALGDAAPAPLELSLGAAAVLVGLLLRVASVRRLGKYARVRRAGALHLHQGGPFAWSRNPIYVANATMALGLGVLAGGGAWALAPLAGIVLVYELAIRHEERTLEALFGAEYAGYRARVARWLGPPRPPSDAAASAPPPFPWGELLRRERSVVLGIPLAVAAIVAARAGLLPAREMVEGLAAPLGLSPMTALLAGLGLGVAITAISTHLRAARHARDAARKAAAAAHPSGLPAEAPTVR